jgi:hypothetical protein
MVQTQPSSSVYDTKTEAKCDGVLSSSEHEGEWGVVEEARARRKQVLLPFLSGLSARLALTLVAVESTLPSFPSYFSGFSSFSSIA